jgi:hypothetical protein
LDTEQRKQQDEGDKSVKRSFIIVKFCKYYFGEQIEKDEMGGYENCIQCFYRNNLKGRNSLRELDVDRGIILKRMLKKQSESVD